MLVALDTNVVDLIDEAFGTFAHRDAAEAMEWPPAYAGVPPPLLREVIACYWIVALAPAWPSVLYTYSDTLEREILAAEPQRAWRLYRTANDVLARASQPAEHRVPDPALMPPAEAVMALGVRSADAEHVADAVGLGCTSLLTNDRALCRRGDRVTRTFGLRIQRPSQYLVDNVRSGAPWPTGEPWPWDAHVGQLAVRTAGMGRL